ncbi:MAG: hypothetical protein N4A76_04115 [Firmicutes bacterium]|jgi:hypothetical protein|nr:hypothetical protein [Bacillota bacterium]
MNELVGIVIISISLLMIIISIFNILKEKLMKLIGVTLIVGLSLVSNSNSNYFLSILVIATLITELDFLQNIAAIIRNSDSYFSYKFQSHQEIENKILKEAEEISEVIKEDGTEDSFMVNDDNKYLKATHFGILVEELTIKYLERKYKKEIKRNILLSEGFRGKLEVDGLMEDNKKIKLFEIKTSKRGFVPPEIVRRSVKKYCENLNNDRYSGRKIECVIVLVGVYNEKQIDELNMIILNYNDKSDVKFSLEIVDFRDIGM